MIIMVGRIVRQGAKLENGINDIRSVMSCQMQPGKTQKQHGVKHFLAAFGYSMCGFQAAVNETAIRHELLLGIVHFILITILDMSLMSRILLTCLYVGVLITELLNTAIEAVVDLVSPGRNEMAKKAKDLGSAAVFCTLVVFVASWILVIMEVNS